MRTGLRLVLEKAPDLTIVGEAAGREDALEMARLQPDIILLNLNAGNDSYLNFLPDLHAVAVGARVLVLIDNFDLELHHRVVRLGVKGLVQKTESAEDMIAAIKKVHAGEVWLDSKTVSHVLDELLYARETKLEDKSRNQGVRITRRERDIIALIGEGLRNKQIAERLEISEPTVRHYLTSIFEKVGVADRLGLIIYAYQHGLAKPPAMAPRPQKHADRSLQNELVLEGDFLSQDK
jgi:DNA-binding NarL/FixJ family response regulator